MKSKELYKKLEQNFIAWAESKEDIRAAFIVGSRARANHPADEWSDMDIIFFTSHQKYYLENNSWLHNIGDISTSFVSTTAGGDSEYLTLFEGVWQVDFVIHSTDELTHIVKNRTIPKNFYRGVKVIVDKDQIANYIVPQDFNKLENVCLTKDSFLKSANMFWFLVLYIAKQLLRNELWVAKMRDGNLKEILLQTMEWYEKVIRGNDYDTWHAGRFLSEWVSQDTLAELQNCFGHFNQKDCWHALIATYTLYQRLSHEIAQKMNYNYPYELEHNVSEWIQQNLL